MREQEYLRGQEEERRRQERKEKEHWENYKKLEAEMDLKLRLQNEARVWQSEDEKLWRQREQLKREEEIEREMEAQGPERIEQKQADDDFNPVLETMAVRAQTDAKNKASPPPKLLVLPWQKVDHEKEKKKHQEKLAKKLQKMQLQQMESRRSDGPPKKKETLMKKVLCLNLGICNSDIQLQVGKLFGKIGLGRPESVSRTASFDANPPPLG